MESEATPLTEDQRSLFSQELEEVRRMAETYEKLKGIQDEQGERPYSPNRAQRRAMSKQARKKQKRNKRE